jgi:hypothetical protein
VSSIDRDKEYLEDGAPDGGEVEDAEVEEVSQRGEVVALLWRSGKREQLRVVHDCWNDHEFATLRVWYRDPEERRAYLPTRRGLSIRRRELARVIAARVEVARRIGVDCGQCSLHTASPG